MEQTSYRLPRIFLTHGLSTDLPPYKTTNARTSSLLLGATCQPRFLSSLRRFLSRFSLGFRLGYRSVCTVQLTVFVHSSQTGLLPLALRAVAGSALHLSVSFDIPRPTFCVGFLMAGL